MRILHAPVNLANEPFGLSRAQRRLGHSADVVVRHPSPFGFPVDRAVGVPGEGFLASRLFRRAAALLTPARYDVLHYYFGRSLLGGDDLGPADRWRFDDLRLARRLGCRIFMTLQGCDLRRAGRTDQRHAIAACRPGVCHQYPDCVGRRDADRDRLAAEILPLCDGLFFLNPDLAAAAPGNAHFMPYAGIDVAGLPAAPPPRPDGPIRIVHAPSDRSIKGTARIEAALGRIARERPIEVTVVEGLPHAEALALYARADLAIDQIYVGWYGEFAVEAMALGRPVAAFIREADLAVIPPAMRSELPLLTLRVDRLEADLRAILDRRREFPALGAAARAFVRRWHDPAAIARAVLVAYRTRGREFPLVEAVAGKLGMT